MELVARDHREMLEKHQQTQLNHDQIIVCFFGINIVVHGWYIIPTNQNCIYVMFPRYHV